MHRFLFWLFDERQSLNLSKFDILAVAVTITSIALGVKWWPVLLCLAVVYVASLAVDARDPRYLVRRAT
jgi:hypothetical protein